MIGSVGREKGKRRKPLQDLVMRFRVGEPLKQLLKNKAGRNTSSPFSRALRSAATWGASKGASRRSARDQTLVSTKRLNRVSARTCSRSLGRSSDDRRMRKPLFTV